MAEWPEGARAPARLSSATADRRGPDRDHPPARLLHEDHDLQLLPAPARGEPEPDVVLGADGPVVDQEACHRGVGERATPVLAPLHLAREPVLGQGHHQPSREAGRRAHRDVEPGPGARHQDLEPHLAVAGGGLLHAAPQSRRARDAGDPAVDDHLRGVQPVAAEGPRVSSCRAVNSGAENGSAQPSWFQ